MAKKDKVINIFKEGKSYNYNVIEAHANFHKKEMAKCGTQTECIGEQFIVLKNYHNDLITSFMLDGSTVNGFTYKCIYTDLEF